MTRSSWMARTVVIVAAWILALLLTPFAGLAGGTYEHARATGKRCATCHDSVRPDVTNLNTTGRFFLVNRRLPREGESTAPAPGQTRESGAAVYDRACATCHGPEGKGTALATSLMGTLEHGDTRDALRTIVRDGVPGTAMVAFAGILSDDQIDRVVQHLIALRKRPLH